jgi:glycosyltransferase involved in cell wall biosynthesis
MPIPEYVVDPTTQQLCSPMQIDPSELADRISTLSQDPERLSQYAEKLHKKVTNYFSISRYAKELRIIYLNLTS